MNNASVPQAAAILKQAAAFADAAKATMNQPDIDALKYAIGQYQLIVDTRSVLENVVKKYNEASAFAATDIKKTQALLNESAKAIEALEKRYTAHSAWFRKAWLRENQTYWLDKAMEPYEKKRNDLAFLKLELREASANAVTHSIPPPSALRLGIMVSDRFYFKNWMLGGPFPLTDKKELPGFLYSSNKEYDKPPSPGDFTHYLGKTYRWQKLSSTDGGIIDLDDNYKSPASVSGYAYCLINASKAINVKAFLAANDEVEVFCNGERVSTVKGGTTQQESTISLPLKEGANHVLLKLRKDNNRPWTFTFRLQDDLSITNHKHKYTLNATNKVYEAD
jgi:hypothetical protein